MSVPMLQAVVSERFPTWVRERGARYFEGGRVLVESAQDCTIEARVQGTRDWKAAIGWDDERAPTQVWAVCSCPDNRRDGACRHVWALVLAVDESGLWPGGESAGTGKGRRRDVSAARRGGSDWRERVHLLGRVAPGAEPPPWPGSQREAEIRYVLDVQRSLEHGAPLVGLQRRERLKNGEWGVLRPFPPRADDVARVEDASERILLALLAQLLPPFTTSWSYYRQRDEAVAERLLGGDLALELLPRMAATGRLSWIGRRGEGALAWDDGPPWELRLQIASEGRHVALRGVLERPAPPARAGVPAGAPAGTPAGESGLERMPLEEPLVLFASGVLVAPAGVARFDPRGLMDFVAELRRGGPIRAPRDQAGAFARVLIERAGEVLLPRPGAVTDAPPAVPHDRTGPTPPCRPAFDVAGLRVERAGPAPHLRLERPDRARPTGRLVCRLSFDYGGVAGVGRVEPGDPRRAVACGDDGPFVLRDPAAERAAAERLLAAGVRRTKQDERERRHGTIAAKQLPALVRELAAADFTIEAEGGLYRSAGATSLSVRSGIDWFEIDGAVAFGDQQAPLPELLAAARAGRDTVTLGDGTIGVLPERWLERWGLLRLAGSGKGGSLRLPHAQAWLIDALLAAREDTTATLDAGFRRFRERIARFHGVEPRAEPQGFTGTLRGYQREGLGWLAFLRELGLGGCLADDMGLGKTVQVLAHLQALRAGATDAAGAAENGAPPQALVVAPRSLVFNWLDEAARFAPGLRVADYTGPGRAARLEEPCDVLVTTYGTLRRDAGVLAERRFDTVVLDEAQAIKNADSQSAKAARTLHADHRLALSGTPVENHLGELWSLFEFLNPGMLGREGAFGTWAGGRRGQGGDLAELSRALRPFFLRRTKEQVLDDLPAKTEQVLACRLDGEERRRYDELREHYRAALLARSDQELRGDQMHVLEALLRLRQCACHPGLLDRGRRGEGSAKLDTLLARLEEVAAEGHKALVFSQFTTLLSIVRDRLDAAGTPYTYLDGRTRKRKDKVERFQSDPACPVFLISLKAGGHGLNLTAADYVFLLDPWWNPAVESQAIDRAHRIGRTRPVHAYRLIAADTVEERIQELQAGKRALAEAVLAGGGGTGAISREDLERLLA